MSEVTADFEVKGELDTRFHQLQTRLNKVTEENEEVAHKTQTWYSSDIRRIIIIKVSFQNYIFT